MQVSQVTIHSDTLYCIVIFYNYIRLEIDMATSTFSSRGAQTMNTIFVKPMLRKSIHKKSASHDIVRDSVKTDGACSAGEAEMKTMRGFSVARETSSSPSESSWVPHEVTGIYYPKGQEKVMQDVPPPPAGSHVEELVNWFS
ncbi:hypothetical protein N665_0476s0001 [Sinapis alba]|nr:hypothetical protein N665_0476s0001 [Sinapis alba]